ncbi:DUF924 family protein [Pseudoroseicyclus aestuarii]|uniref:Uncharacterized protein (DUF924 family) n=1 Tax=Pseudoroseicyclus aestuarii TaxID=1795041 RepID=A0A318T1E4_9RHOB|nr:DUF924 family protein [Pseudoroseicyclus aestuarii]PYE85797.1 uncharacterized protein (DUF924 family) [Pseudoroseicyclus aestuarii]
MTRSEELRRWWIEEIGPEGWYKGGEALDSRIREQWLDLWQEAEGGGLGHWLVDAQGTLSYLILTDQLPRNMFRGTGQAFATDARARAAAKMGLERDWDQRFDGLGRQFFYMPLEHSESLIDQDRAVALFEARLSEPPDYLHHARAHRAVIRQFGRFPFRNEALGRETTPEEAAWIEAGGYGAEVERIKAKG